MRTLLNHAVNIGRLAQPVRQFFSGISLLDLARNIKRLDSINDCLVCWPNYDTAVNSA